MRRLGGQAIPVTRAQIDLADKGTIRVALSDVNPDAIVNCAAYTNVDRAEHEEDLATRINSEAVGVMADWAADRRLPFLTFSTDYVFDGKASTPYLESSPTNPINAYGRSKLRGEKLAVEAGGLVVRTSWVISGSHPNFVATMIRLATEGGPLKVVNDQRGCPTVCADLAATTHQALVAGMTGILHVTNQGATTWFELARRALAEAGLDPDALSPCMTADYPTDAPRPAYSVLGSERLESSGLTLPPNWIESLPALVSEIKSRL